MPTAPVHHAKVFRTGGSLAVRIPKSCRIAEDGEAITIRRDGSRLILEAGGFPPAFIASLGSLADEDFPSMPRQQRSRLADRAPL